MIGGMKLREAKGVRVGNNERERGRRCYVRVERSARLELAGYDQVALPVVNGASALGTR